MNFDHVGLTNAERSLKNVQCNTDFLHVSHSEHKFFSLILDSLLPGKRGKIKF